MNKLFLIIISFIFVVSVTMGMPVMGANQTEILWDSWGIPHIEGKDSESLFKAFGWAQTHSHGDLILRLYGQGRGKAAEYWGESYLESDRYVQMMGIPARAKDWYEAQNPEMRRNLDAFAEGINNYVKKYPNRINDSVKAVLPVTGIDIIAHTQRVIHFNFVMNPQQIASLKPQTPKAGSNGWAIAPKHSASGKAMLLANPHLPWSDFYLWYEAQLTAPGVDIYGAALVGMPVLAIAFNDNLGWTTTVNPRKGTTIYELNLKENGYLWDGKVQPFEIEKKQIKVRHKDGSYLTIETEIKHSIQGVIIAQKDDKAYALRVVGLDRPEGLEQLWQMAQARNLNQFETALKRLQIPLFNFLYADNQGEIFYLFNAQIPLHKTGDWQFWEGIISGDKSETLWTKYHAYEDLPRLHNPETGWLQNTNDPPWSSTFPPVLKAEDYPAYFAPSSLAFASNIFRTQRSLKLLEEADKISFEEMIAKKFSSRLEMADRILPLLIPAAKLLANPIGLEAADVLKKWDHQTNADSKGAVLFMFWASTLEPYGFFSKPWNEENYLTTPTGLADINTALAVLEGVAAQVKLLYSSLDIPWGEVVRLRYGKYDLPASGGPGKLGSFRVLNLAATEDEKFQVVFGDTYIAAIAFSNPIQAKVLTVYGNATQPNSPHIGDQLPLYSKGEMRPVWRNREEIKQHLELREVFD